MSSLNTLRLLCLALFAGVVLAGCNVFEGFHEPGTSNDPQILLTDAQLAMQAGDPEKAVVILEKAAAKADPATFQGIQVNNLLGDAKLKVAGIGVLQLQQMVDDINDRIENGTSSKLSTDPSGVCSFASPDEAVGVVTLDDIQGYAPIRNNPELIAEVRFLTTGTMTRMAALQARYGKNPLPNGRDSQHPDWIAYLVNEWIHNGIDLNTGYECKPGSNCYKLNRESIATFAMRGTIVMIGGALHELNEAGGDEITWYRVRSGSDHSLGYCAPSQEVLDRVEAQASCSMKHFEYATGWLEHRARLFPEKTFAHEIAELAREGYDHLAKELSGECSTFESNF